MNTKNKFGQSLGQLLGTTHLASCGKTVETTRPASCRNFFMQKLSYVSHDARTRRPQRLSSSTFFPTF